MNMTSKAGRYFIGLLAVIVCIAMIVPATVYAGGVAPSAGSQSAGLQIDFTEMPLVIPQTPLVSHVLTAAELKASLKVTDAVDYPVWTSDADGRSQPLWQNMTATPTLANGLPTTIDTQHIGVTRVKYEATNSLGNTVTAERLVVVNDGRYTVGEGRVLFAKPFVIKKNAVATSSLIEINSQIRAQSGTKLIAGGGETSFEVGTTLPNDQTSFVAGSYTNIVGVYDILVSGIDHPTATPAITKSVKAEVVDADIIESGPDSETEDTYYAFGNNISITSVQADAIQAAGSSVLLSALGAGSRKTNADGTLQALTTVVGSYGGFNTRATGSTGMYNIVVSDAGSHKSASLMVFVSTVCPPVLIVAPRPLVIPITAASGIVSDSVLMGTDSLTDNNEVYVMDEEGGTLSVVIDQNGDGFADTANILTNIAGVTKVTYSVTDVAGNIQSQSRAVIIDDGSFVWNNDYILRANGFVIKRGDVSASDKISQIKSMSEAQAWDVEGDAYQTSRISISGDGGYKAVAGDYSVALSLQDDPSLTKQIKVKVYADTKEHESGALYTIIGGSFSLSVKDANALAATSDANIESQLLSIAGVESYSKAGDLSAEEGTKRLVSVIRQGGTIPFSSQADNLMEGDMYDVTFWVDEDHTTTITVTLQVSDPVPPGGDNGGNGGNDGNGSNSGNGDNNGKTTAPAPASIFRASAAEIADETWTGKAITPALVLKYAGKLLIRGTDYTAVYKDNTGIGKATVTVTGKGQYTGTKTIAFTILPTKIAVKKATAGKKKIKVTWQKAKAAQKISKYQVRYRVKGTSKWKTKTVSANAKSLTIKKLKKGKTYQIQIAAYKIINSGASKGTYRGAWSKAKAIKI